MVEHKLLKVEEKDRVAIVSLNNPPLNLITLEMLSELRATILELASNKELRCIILTGEGPKAFSAGMDAESFGSIPPGANTPMGQMIANTLELCPLPIIAAINGYALGGGLEILLACDIRIAADTAKMGLVEASIGLIASYGGLTRLPWLIGEGNAKKLFFTAARISGEEAKEYGLVDEVVPADQLMDAAMDLALKIAGNAPLSIAAAKKMMFEFREPLFGVSFLNEQIGGPLTGRSEDHKEGWAAFKEKRKPNFQNK